MVVYSSNICVSLELSHGKMVVYSSNICYILLGARALRYYNISGIYTR